MGAAQVARHQRGRLEGAMLEAVTRHGYAETTVDELVTLAGVSKSTFYARFTNKQECFLATFDEILAQVTQMVGVAYRSHAGFEERLREALARFVEIVAEEPAAAALVVVDSLSLGTEALDARERAAASFELMFRQSFQQAEGGRVVSDLKIRAIVAGIRRVVYRRLRMGRPEELRDYVDDLLTWSLSYGRRSETNGRAPISSPPRSSRVRVGTEASAPQLSWEEPAASPRSRAELTQRERIMRAAAQAATEKGYAALSIPAISAAAGISNQTFYEHFASKREAFIATYDALATNALHATAAASQAEDDWPAAVEAGIWGLLDFIAHNRLFAHLAFFELPTAGPDGLDHADITTERFSRFLQPEALPDGLGPLPNVAIEAIGGGMWSVIQHEIAHDRRESLPELAPQIAELARAPLGL
jgi:AcrR family transcriptional regulator